MPKPQIDKAYKTDNAFAIIGTACRVLNRSGQKDLAKEYHNKVMDSLNSLSHDALVELTAQYVDFV